MDRIRIADDAVGGLTQKVIYGAWDLETICGDFGRSDLNLESTAPPPGKRGRGGDQECQNHKAGK